MHHNFTEQIIIFKGNFVTEFTVTHENNIIYISLFVIKSSKIGQI